jgi:site-specific recombinase XerD
MTLMAVGRWVGEQREKGQAEEGIASRLAALKVFSRKYVWLHLELTTVDLLQKVPRISTRHFRPKEGLSEEEIKALLDSYDRNTYEDVRNQAMIAVYLSTGLRFREVLWQSDELDKITGEFNVTAKGGKERTVRMSPRALKLVKAYLRVRPASTSGKLWVTETGDSLTYWAGQSIFRRLKQRSGVTRPHAHLCRHTLAQEARKRRAAELMPRFSPI